MIVLTEAPTCNIIAWASPMHELSGAIHKEISTGYHTIEAWKSVIFQLTYAMAVLQEKEIYIRNFSFENNVFIKDLFNDPNNMGHWIYNVNDIDMYVPNYGHVVLLDSRFVDIVGNIGYMPGMHKIESSSIYTSNYNIPNIKTDILTQFKTLFDDTQTINRLKNDYGFLNPPHEINNIFDAISKSTETNIKDIILNIFPEYIHNRVGTLLTRTERDNLTLTILPDLKEGNMVVYQSRYDEYKWAIFNKDVGRKKEIIIKENDKIIKINVFSHTLIHYPDSHLLPQTAEKTYRLNKESLIDSYKLK